MYLTTDPLKENTLFADSLRMNWSIVLCWLVIISSLKWWHSFLCTSDTTTATATKTSLKKWSRAASNLIVLIPSRSVRQILAIFSGVENIYKLLVGVRSNTISSSDHRIKRVLIHIFCGHILELILTEIFRGFLNIYKILRILREQNIVRFQRPKITSDTWFQTEKDIPHYKKQSLSFQNMLSKLCNI